MIFQWSKGMLSPPPKNMEGPFYKSFSWQMGAIFWEAVLHGGLMIRSCQMWGSFTNAFSSNLKTVYKSWNFCQSQRDVHLKIKPWPVYRIMKVFILEVNSKLEDSKVVSYSAWPWQIICKGNSKNRGMIALEKHPLHTMPHGLEIFCKAYLLL